MGGEFDCVHTPGSGDQYDQFDQYEKFNQFDRYDEFNQYDQYDQCDHLCVQISSPSFSQEGIN